ncbi:MAG: lipid-A-disaccharide synthase [Bacteroidales bacterium]|nr:lipid-A-disaccharide synthase [Bacteroidales bacterium]
MKYYLIAGEASGDLHGANLMRALRQKDPQAEFRFWGGDNMAAIGGTPVRHIRDLAIMGFVEVLAHLRTVLGNIAFCKRDIAQWKPDVVVGIDYPGFNLKIEAWAHEQGFKTVHYISPNLWAWKKGRIKGMRRTLDRLCYILPFEEEFFAENDMPQAVYVGHPLLDMINEECGKKGLNQPIQPSTQTRPIIALLPGSRRMELKNSLPLMVHLAAHHPEYQFVVAGMSLIGKDFYDTLIAKQSSNQTIKQSNNLTVVFDQTYSLLSQAHAAIVCSGTATLEAALFNVPQVVCYSGNPISYLIAKAVVGNRIRYISLVNLIADSPIVTELIQDDFNAERLEREFLLVAADDANRERMLNEYADMRTLLGSGGASMRAAQTIIDILK